MIGREVKICVLRIGHRPERDKRVTTHVALTARAFGASCFVLGDVEDQSVSESLRKVCERWGCGGFEYVSGVSSVEFVKKWKSLGGSVVHLTMYGLHVDDVINTIKSLSKDLLVVVGASKVPRIFYELADFNIAIGHQPHSEVAALAIFLDRLFEGKELHLIFSDAKYYIEPSVKGKKVIRVE
jgi:tRNA (cytidine56-2'-O)-methyltransferase